MVGRGISLITALLLVCFLPFISSAPSKTAVCASDCVPSFNQRFRYLQGKTYIYKYETNTIVGLPGVSNDTGTIHFKATAEIHVLTNCDFALKIHDVKLNSSGSMPDVDGLRQTLESKPLMFVWHDGKIGGICASSKDPVWATNIRRGIVSAFQMSLGSSPDYQKSVVEDDIIGTCMTHYDVIENQLGTIIINKSKDVTTCKHRLDIVSSVRTISQSSNLNMSTLPLTYSTHSCQQTITGGIIKITHCHERHQLRPFSNEEKGAVTQVHQQLTHIRTKDGILKHPPRNLVREMKLLYDHRANSPLVADSQQESLALLQSLCFRTSLNIEASVAKDFTQLVYLVRRLSRESIIAVWDKLSNNQVCKEGKIKDIFLSSLPMAQTEAAVFLMTKLLLSHDVTDETWIMSLNFISNPSLETVEAAIPLIKTNSPSALLAVSSLAHTYCLRHPACEKDQPIQKLISFLAKRLGTKCHSATQEEKEKVILVLKAFGNLGRMGKASAVLSDCIQQPSLPTEVSLAAMESQRRMPCTQQLKKMSINVFENETKDPEVRIAAYLSLMRCQWNDTGRVIEDVLRNEPVNQVSFFVWSHLGNLRESLDPMKTSRDYSFIDDISFAQKFSDDFRKYSTNFEGSVKIDQWDAIATAEANWIFSSKSYIPRSLTLNLTLDLFDQRINYLEVGLRGENFEFLLESLLSSLSSSDKGSSDNKESSSLRSFHQEFDNKVISTKEPEMSFYVRVFGNEIGWFNIRNKTELRSFYKWDKREKLRSLLRQLHHTDTGSGWMFLDSSFVVPTISGFLLRMSVNGTLMAGLKSDGRFDQDLYLSEQKISVDGMLIPSTALEISGMMAVDVGDNVLRAGIKFITTLHSTIHLEGKVTLKKGSAFKLDINVPKDLDIAGIKMNKFLIHQNKERQLTSTPTEHYDVTICSDRMKRALALELCAAAKLPKPLVNNFPLGGPVDVQVTLKKTDPNLRGYHLNIVYAPRQDESGFVEELQVQFTFKAIGTTTTTDIDFGVSYYQPEKSLDIRYHSFTRTFDLSANAVIESNLKRLNVVATVDTEVYSLNAQTIVDDQDYQVTYTPEISIKIPGSDINFSGSLVYQPWTKFSVTLRSNYPVEKPNFINVTIDVDSDSEEDDFYSFVTLEFPSYNLSLNGPINIRNNNVSFRLDGSHSLAPQWHLTPLSVTGKMVHQKSEFSECMIALDIDSSTPWSFEWNRTRTEDSYNNKFLIWRGSDPDYGLEYLIRTHESEKSLTLLRRVQIIHSDTEFTAQLSLSKRPQVSLDAFTSLSIGSRKWITEVLYASSNKNLSAGVSLLGPSSVLEVQGTVQQTSVGHWEGLAFIRGSNGSNSTLRFNCRNIPNPFIFHETSVLFTSSSLRSPVLFNYRFNSSTGHSAFNVLVKGPWDSDSRVDFLYLSERQTEMKINLNYSSPFSDGDLNLISTPLMQSIDLRLGVGRKRLLIGRWTSQGSEMHRLIEGQMEWKSDKLWRTAMKYEKITKEKQETNFKMLLDMNENVIVFECGYSLPRSLLQGLHSAFIKLELAPGKIISTSASLQLMPLGNHFKSRGELVLQVPSVNRVSVDFETFLVKRSDTERSLLIVVNLKGPSEPLTHMTVRLIRSDIQVDLSIEVDKNEWQFRTGIGGKIFLSEEDEDLRLAIVFQPHLEDIPDFQVNLEFLRSTREASNFRHIAMVVWNDVEVGWKTEYNIQNYESGSFDIFAKAELKTPFKTFMTQDSVLRLKYRDKPRKVSTELEMNFEQDKWKAEIHWNRLEKRVYGALRLHVPYIKLRRVDITYETNSRDNLETTVVSLRWDATHEIHFSNELMWSDSKKGLSAVLITPFAFTVAVKANHLIQSSYRHSSDITFTWNGGSTVTLNVDAILEPNGGFDVTFILYSPLLLDVWMLTAKMSVSGSRRNIALRLNITDGWLMDANFATSSKIDGFKARGVVKFNEEEVFQADLEAKDRGSSWLEDKEAVYVLRVLETAEPIIVKVFYFKTNRNTTTSAELCWTNDNICYGLGMDLQAEVNLLKRKVHTDITLHTSLKESVTSTSKFRTHLHLDALAVRHGSKISWHVEENKFVGYDFGLSKHYDKYEARAEVDIPTRLVILSANHQCSTHDCHSRGHFQADARHRTDRKVSLALDLRDTAVKTHCTAVQGVLSMEIPDHPRPLKLMADIKLNENNTIAESKVVVDLSQDSQRKLDVHLLLTDESAQEVPWNYSLIGSFQQARPKPINIQLNSHIGSSMNISKAEAEFSWYNRQNLWQNSFIQSYIDSINNIIQIKAKSLMKTVGILLRNQSVSEEDLHIGVEAFVDDDVIQRLNTRISKKPDFDLRYYHVSSEPDDNVHIKSTLDREFLFTAQRNYASHTVDDVMVYMNLSTSRLLRSAVRWRPELISEYREFRKQRLESLRTGWQEFKYTLLDEIDAEVADKEDNYWDTVELELDPLLQAAIDELRAIGKDIIKTFQYESTTRGLTPIQKARERFTLESVVEVYEGVKEQMKGFVSNDLESSSEESTDDLEGIQTHHQHADTSNDTVQSSRILVHWWDAVLSALKSLSDIDTYVDPDLKSILQDSWQWISEEAARISEDFIETLNHSIASVGDCINSVELDLISYFMSLTEWFSDSVEAVFMLDLSQEIPKHVNEAISTFTKLFKSFGHITQNEQNSLSWFETDDQYVNCSECIDIIKEIEEELNKTLRFFKSECTLKYFMQKVMFRIRDDILSSLGNLTYDINKGRIDYSLPLLLPVSSLKDLENIFSRNSSTQKSYIEEYFSWKSQKSKINY